MAGVYGMLVLYSVCVSTVTGVKDDMYGRLLTRLDFLENKVTELSQQVNQQYLELENIKSVSQHKDSEIDELRALLKDKHTLDRRALLPLIDGEKVSNRRFLLGNETSHVAFFARLDQTELTGINKLQTILFDNVVVNDGAGFDQTTGTFTVPVGGLYLISVAITSDLGHSHEIQVALMKNNDIIARAHAHGDSGHLDQGGITVVEEFNAEDKLYVRSLSDDGAALYGVGLTSLSAVRII